MKQDSKDGSNVYQECIAIVFLARCLSSNDFKTADELLESITGFQKTFGSKVRPSEERITSEVLYNKYDVFNKLTTWYIL
jgi:hypothetical protein